MKDGKLIGLIGGVGPWAGLDVHRKILEESGYESEQECVSVMHLSFPGKYTDRTDYILGKTTVNPAYAFIEEFRTLESAGAQAAAIVCNTAHAAPIFDVMHEYLQESNLQYIHIIQETQRELELDGVRKAGLLATLGTYNLELYRQRFNGTILHPDTETQQRVHAVIYDPEFGLKMHYPNTTEQQYDVLIQAGHSLIEQGAEALILGCTELPLLKAVMYEFNVPVYDPNRILAQRLVEACQPETAKKELLSRTQEIFNL